MNCISTRGHTPATTLSAALSAGLAPDGGLFVPETLPQLAARDFPADAALAAVAAQLLAPFFAGDVLAPELTEICASALDFPAPLRPLRSPDAAVLELFHGPSAAFKDYGARFLARCLARLPRADGRPRTILVATSGDTGAAVGAAFHGLAGFRVLILYPDGRVSPRQAHQLGAFGDNVRAVAVRGSFDDCQALAKQALADRALQARVPLSSANSISLGRLLPQMSYYAAAALAHWRATGAAANFIVPTGNLGNALACVLVRAVGLPVGDIVLATNANATLPDFFAGSDYRPRASMATLANAMDVGAPSNFERLRWWHPDAAELRRLLRAERVDDAAIRGAIAAAPARHGIIPCPHTATSLVALERLRAAGDRRHWIIVATAHPAKFEQIVEPLVGHPVPPPPGLARLLARPSTATPMSPEYAALVATLEKIGSSRMPAEL